MRNTEIQFQLAAIDANPEAFAQIKNELATVVKHATEVLANG